LYALVHDMILHYEDRHARQSVGLEGPDLIGQRRRQISANAKNITRDSIQDFGDSFQFHIASHSRPGQYHAVDLRRPICNCEDFPRILFCRHVAAVYVHFPHLDPEVKGSTLINVPERVQPSAPPHCSLGGGESLQALSQEVFSLSQALTSRQGESAPNPAIIEAFRSAKYSLTTAIASLDGNAPLPEKDVIAPNQRSWPETAERMGAKKAPRRPCLPEERGLTERSLGVVKGKRKRLHNDPYAGGERSGKRAKPDALRASQAANTRSQVPDPFPPSAPPPSEPFPPYVPPPHAPSPIPHWPHVPSPPACLPHAPSPTVFLPTLTNGPH
jgi:hypothetical protein